MWARIIPESEISKLSSLDHDFHKLLFDSLHDEFECYADNHQNLYLCAEGWGKCEVIVTALNHENDYLDIRPGKIIFNVPKTSMLGRYRND